MKICEADFDRMMCDPTREISKWINGLSRLAFLGLEAYLWGQAVRPRGGPLRCKSVQSPDSSKLGNWQLP